MYKITKNTYAILAYTKTKSKIIEKEKIFYINSSVNDIIEYNCYINGSTLKGRQKASAYLLGIKAKPPAILSETEEIIIFPTHSIINEKSSWIVLKNVLKYSNYRNKKTVVEFQNHEKIIINISPYIFDQQIIKATRLEFIIKRDKSAKML